MNRKPQDWQRDPNKVETVRVQYWSNGVMVTANLKLCDAQQWVRIGKAFVINPQAIGRLDENGNTQS